MTSAIAWRWSVSGAASSDEHYEALAETWWSRRPSRHTPTRHRAGPHPGGVGRHARERLRGHGARGLLEVLRHPDHARRELLRLGHGRVPQRLHGGRGPGCTTASSPSASRSSATRGGAASARSASTRWWLGTTAPSLFAMPPTATSDLRRHQGGAREGGGEEPDHKHMSPRRTSRWSSEEQVLAAPIIAAARPLRLLPDHDGAAACHRMLARGRTVAPARCDPGEGLGLSVTSGEPYLKPGFAYHRLPRHAPGAQSAYEQAGITPKGPPTSPRCTTASRSRRSSTTRPRALCRGRGLALRGRGRAAIGGEVAVNPSAPQVVRAPDRRDRDAHALTEVCQQLWHRPARGR